MLGAIPVGDLIARSAGVSIREVGTGNPGTANIMREVGTKHAIAVLLLDFTKGTIVTLPVYVFNLAPSTVAFAVFAVLLGHFSPVFWKFKGGTGMVVAMGVTAGLLPLGSLFAALIGLPFLWKFKHAPYTGLLFFVIAVITGGFVQQDLMKTAIVTMAAVSILVKSLVQYRSNPFGR